MIYIRWKIKTRIFKIVKIVFNSTKWYIVGDRPAADVDLRAEDVAPR